MSFYIKLGSTFYELDATTEITVTYPATLTTNPVHSKRNVSDNYFTEQPTMTIQGIVSDVKVAGNRGKQGTASYIDGLIAAMNTRTPLSVKHRLDKEEDPNWFINSFTPSQDQQHGFGGFRPGVDGKSSTVVQSFKISISLSQAIIAEAATLSVEVPKAYLDSLQTQASKTATVQEFGASKAEITDYEQAKEDFKNAKANNKRFADAAFSGVLAPPTTP
jgi:hypothetical protein